ncbi:hypothetical protein Tco_0051790 [Tanacetum coccineum]
MEKVVVGKDGKPLRAARRVQFDANRPAVNEHGKLIGKDGKFGTSMGTNPYPNLGIVQEEIPNFTQESVDGNMLNATAEVSASENEKDQDAWEDPKINAMKNTFANVVTAEQPKKKLNFRTLTNDARVAYADFVLPRDTIAEVKQRLANSLVGYFVGKFVAFPLVENYVTNTWAKFGFQKVIKDEDGFFFFKFSSIKGLEQVPVWVKMHKVHVVAYSEDGLSLIATQIGKPHMLDALTSSMCVGPWGRLGFARALIEVSAEKPIKQEVVMAVPEEDGEGYTKETVRLEYEWKPPICMDCHVFGHSNEQYPKRVKETPAADTPVDNDGFNTVSKKKKKGKVVEKWQPRVIEGIKLTKPKPSFSFSHNSQPSLSKQPKKTIVNTKNQFDARGDQNDDTGEIGEANGLINTVLRRQAPPHHQISMFSIASWNIRGLNRPLKQSEVRQVVNITNKKSGNVPSVRRHLWTELDIHNQVVQSSPWVLTGDFNVALNMEDVSTGSSSMNSAMNDFKECVANIEVLDINCSGLHYTWNQKPKGSNGILKKLDRIMGNLGFVDKFPSAHAVFKPYRVSDHAPAVLKFPTLAANKPKPFKPRYVSSRPENEGAKEAVTEIAP